MTDREADKKSVIFLHGLASGPEVWTGLMEKIQGKYACYAPELPGHGQAERMEVPGMDTLLAWLKGFMTQHDISRPVLVGHSIGGSLSLLYACSEPDSYRGLIIVDARTGQLLSQSRKETLLGMAVRDSRDFRQMSYTLMAADPGDQERIVERALTMREDQFLGLYRDYLLRFNLQGQLSLIDKPALLFISGVHLGYQQEEAFLRETGYRDIPWLEAVFCRKSRHFIMYDYRALFEKKASDFLEKL